MIIKLAKISRHKATRFKTYRVNPAYFPCEDKGKLGWHADGTTRGTLENFLNLGRGDFRVEFQAEEGEFESWLENLAEQRPKEAMPLLVKMLDIAVNKVLN